MKRGIIRKKEEIWISLNKKGDYSEEKKRYGSGSMKKGIIPKKKVIWISLNEKGDYSEEKRDLDQAQ